MHAWYLFYREKLDHLPLQRHENEHARCHDCAAYHADALQVLFRMNAAFAHSSSLQPMPPLALG